MPKVEIAKTELAWPGKYNQVYKECDFRIYCSREGTIKLKEEDL